MEQRISILLARWGRTPVYCDISSLCFTGIAFITIRYSQGITQLMALDKRRRSMPVDECYLTTVDSHCKQ